MYGRLAGAQLSYRNAPQTLTLRDMKRIFVMQRPYLLLPELSAALRPQALTVKPTASLKLILAFKSLSIDKPHSGQS